MSLIEILKFYNEKAMTFFEKFSENFKPEMPLDQFNKYRLYFINLLSNVLKLNNFFRIYQIFSTIKNHFN